MKLKMSNKTKRHGSNAYLTLDCKKRKLDISITRHEKGSSSISTSSKDRDARIMGPPAPEKAVAKPVLSKNVKNQGLSAVAGTSAKLNTYHNSSNWLDDEDDDFCIEASQLADDAQSAQNILMTFDQFRSISTLKSSTQRMLSSPPKTSANDTAKPNKRMINSPISIFDDDSIEIDFESTPNSPPLLSIINGKTHQKEIGNNNVEISVEKTVPTTSSGMNSTEKDYNYVDFLNDDDDFFTEIINSQRNMIENLQKNKPLPATSHNIMGQETMQIPDLVKKLAELELENTKHKALIVEQNKKIQTKEGEVAVLRFDKKQLQGQVDALKLQKISETDVVKKEWQERLTEWERKFNAAQLELNMKNNEVMIIRQGLSGERNTIELKKNFKTIASLIFLNIKDELKIFENRKTVAPIDLFMRPEIKSKTFIGCLFEEQFNVLSNILAESSYYKMKEARFETVYGEIKNSFDLTISQFQIYLDSIQRQSYHKNNQRGVKCLSKKVKLFHLPNNLYYNRKSVSVQSFFQDMEIISNESLVSARRYFTVFSMLCEMNPRVSKILLGNGRTEVSSDNTQEQHIETIKKSIEILQTLNDSENLCLFEAYIFLFNSLAKTSRISSDVILLLRILLFKCRPNFMILLKTSELLLNISKYCKKSIVGLLCDKCNGNSCIYNESKKTLQIRQKFSCILQVYCSILNVIIQDVDINMNLFQCLCHNYFSFIRNCLEIIPHFVYKPSLESVTNKCHCFLNLSTTFVNLFGIYLSKLKNDNISYSETRNSILRLGSLLVYDFYHTHYSPHLLQASSNNIKERILFICDRLEYYDLSNKPFEECKKNVKSSSIFADFYDNVEDCVEIHNQNGLKHFNSSFQI